VYWIAQLTPDTMLVHPISVCGARRTAYRATSRLPTVPTTPWIVSSSA
jgi:hypothetical protein